MATPITKTVNFLPGADYPTWREAEAVNRNLVGTNEAWTVQMAGGIQPFGQQQVNGWTTDATRFLSYEGVALPDTNVLNCENLLDRAVMFGDGAAALQLVDWGGATGFITFKNMVFIGLNFNGGTVTLNVAGKARFINCIFINTYNGGGNAYTLVVNHANAVIECFNCLFTHKMSPGGGGVNVIAATSATFYHCTALVHGLGFNMGGQTAVLKNCYSKGSTAYANLAGATLTKCASSDATGSVGLQNVAFTPANWNSASAGFENDPEPLSGNPCVGGGADLSGEAAPFNISTDILGRPRTIATPDVGCREYLAANPRIRHWWVGAGTASEQWICDYAGVAAASLANLDLVTRQEKVYIELAALDQETNTQAVFNGWTTSATYSLTVRGRRTGFFKQQQKFHRVDALSAGYYRWSRTNVGTMITIGNIGASGLLVFDGIQVSMTGATGDLFLNDTTGTGGTVLIEGCHLIGTGAACKVISAPASAGNKFNVLNSTLYGVGLTTAPVVDWNANVLNLLHCTLFQTAVVGAAKTIVDMHNTVGCAVKNCLARVTDVVATSFCYKNMTNVDFQKCASSDATGTDVAIQNVVYDGTNFIEDSGVHDRTFIPLSTGVLAQAGLSLAAGIAPLNCTHDIKGQSRFAPHPTIGAIEANPGHSDYFGTWTWNVAGFDATNDNYVTTVTRFSVDGKLYAAVAGNSGKPGKVYSSSDDGLNWVLEYTAPVNQFVRGGVEFGGKLYFVIYDLAKIVTYDPSGPTWSTGADNLNAASGFPTFVTGLITDGTKLYAIPFVNGFGVYSSTNGTTWTADATFPTWINNGGCAGAYCMANGDIFVLGRSFISWRKFGTTTWGTFSYRIMAVGGPTTEAFLVDEDNSKVYWSCANNASGYGGPGTGTWVFMLDLITLKIVVGTPFDTTTGRTTYWLGKIKNDIWWGSASAANPTPTGLNLSISGSDLPDVFEGYYTRLTFMVGVNPDPFGQLIQNGNCITSNSRAYIGGGGGATAGPGVIRSPLLSNATQFDDVTIQQAQWNTQRFAASVMMRGISPNDAGYSELDSFSRDSVSLVSRYYARKASSYYRAASATWAQQRSRMDLREGPVTFRETGVHLLAQLFKDGQEVIIDALQLTQGSGIPTSFAHPLEPRTVESFTIPNIVDLNAFRVEMTWIPTGAFGEIDVGTVELARFAIDATNYIRLVLRPSSSQREYVADQVSGAHDPVIRLEKVLAGVSVAQVDLACYWGYDLSDPNEGTVEDPIEIAVTHTAGDALELRLGRAGSFNGNWASAGAAFAIPALGGLTLNGPGYFGPPEVVKTFRTKGGRYLPVGRVGIGPRTAGQDTGQVLAGERDPTAGQIVIADPYASPGDIFDRVDAGTLGADWTTYIRNGVGFTIIGNAADCAQEGWEIWNRPHRNDNITLSALVTILNDGVSAGLFSRLNEHFPSPFCYSAELTQTGSLNANVRLVAYSAGSFQVIGQQALSSYTAGETLFLQLAVNGGTLTANVLDGVTGAVRATLVGTGMAYLRPRQVGMYAITGAVGQHVRVDSFTVVPNFLRSVE